MFPSLVRGDQNMFRSAGARKNFRGRVFYKHLAPNGAKSNNVLVHFEVEYAHIPKSLRPDYSVAPFGAG